MKPTDALISKIYSGTKLYIFLAVLCPPSGVIQCTFGTGACYTGLTTACKLSSDLYNMCFIVKKFVTIHGYKNVIFTRIV
jgi:hypothetical protein